VRERLDAGHGGDRRSWALILAPLAGIELGTGALAVAVGGLAMKKASAALVLLLLGIGGYVAVAGRGEESSSRVVAQAPAHLDVAPEGPEATMQPPRVAGLATAGPVDQQRAPSVEAPASPFTGRLVDPEGRPIPGASVEGRYYWAGLGLMGHHDGPPLVSVASEADGRFRLDAPSTPFIRDANKALVRIRAEGFAVRHETLERSTEARIILGHGGLLALRVTDERGAPVAAATAEVCDGEEEIPVGLESYARPRVEIEGSANGRLDLRLAAGRYRARVGAPGLRRVDTDVLVVEDGRTTERTIALDEGIVAEFHVVGEAGEPVAGAMVWAVGPLGSNDQGVTDADGRRRVPGIALPVAVRANGIPDDRMHYRVEAEGFVHLVQARILPPGTAVIPIEVRLARGIQIRVRVVDPAGAPVPAPTARWMDLHPRSGPLWKEPEGILEGGDWIRMPRVTPGARRISVQSSTDETYEGVMRDLAVGPEGGDVTLTIARLDRAVVGVVLGPDSAAVREGGVGYEVASTAGSRSRAHGSTTLGADGRFHLERLRAGPGTFTVSVPGHAPQRFHVEIAADGPVQVIELRLRPGKPIAGRVVDRGGSPLAGLQVDLWRQVETEDHAWTSVHEAKTTTAADGTFAFVAEEGKAFRIGIASPQWTPMQDSMSDVSAGATDLLVRLKPASEGWGMALRVFANSGGRPYDGPLKVSWRTAAGLRLAMELPADSRAGRRFGVWGDVGTYDLTLSAPSHLPTMLKGIALDETPEGKTVTVALDRGAAVRVRIRGGDGGLLSGTWVRLNGLQARTDDVGECESTGWEPGSRAEFTVSLDSDPEFTVAWVAGVTAPATVDVTLQRRGFVWVHLGTPYGRLATDVVVRLTDARGMVVDEQRVQAVKVREWVGEARCQLSVVAAGTYTITAEAGERRGRVTVEARLGERVEPTVIWR
jgi:protocatechuate 3,4-dioxygenase beta subunit